MLRFIFAGLAAFQFGSAAADVPCGGDFDAFVDEVKREALASGHSRQTLDAFFADVRHDPEVIRRDNRQGIFKKTFIEFSKLVMSEHRIIKGKEFREKHGELLASVERRFGVPPGVMLSFLALETDYGVVQGDFNTLDSIATLAHDCRRPELFRPHLLAAISLFERGDFDPKTTVGAWAGEIGMIQMLPEDILLHGIDGDGDGRVDLKNSPADALMTAGNVLQGLGWRGGEPWLVEVLVPPGLDWSQTGLDFRKPVSAWGRLGVKARVGELPKGQLGASILPSARPPRTGVSRIRQLPDLLRMEQVFRVCNDFGLFRNAASTAGPDVSRRRIRLRPCPMRNWRSFSVCSSAQDMTSARSTGLSARRRARQFRRNKLSRDSLPMAWPTSELLQSLRLNRDAGA